MPEYRRRKRFLVVGYSVTCLGRRALCGVRLRWSCCSAVGVRFICRISGILRNRIA